LDCENEDKQEKDEENNENQIKKENNDDQEKEERKAQLIESEKTISNLRFFIDNFKVRGGKKIVSVSCLETLTSLFVLSRILWLNNFKKKTRSSRIRLLL